MAVNAVLYGFSEEPSKTEKATFPVISSRKARHEAYWQRDEYDQWLGERQDPAKEIKTCLYGDSNIREAIEF